MRSTIWRAHAAAVIRRAANEVKMANGYIPLHFPMAARVFFLKRSFPMSAKMTANIARFENRWIFEDVRLNPEETAKVFLDYYNQKKVFGLFLSSGVMGTSDFTMERLNSIARILRKKHKFKGYIHLKVIPGSSNAAVEEAVSLASAVSLNIETPGEKNLAKLSNKKNYIKDIIEPMKLISNLTQKGSRYERVKQTTQFIVGAAGEHDSEIVKYMFGLYDRLNMNRVYFSAYQRGLGEQSITGEKYILENPADILTREHRLYQVDFLLRKYGFKESDIMFEKDGNLSLATDPKEIWAKMHPEMFPVDINKASKSELLKVPGLGPVTVDRIIKARKISPVRSIEQAGKVGSRLDKGGKIFIILTKVFNFVF